MHDLPRLHLVTDAEVLTSPGFPTTAERLCDAGGPAVALHLRGPGLPGRRMWDLCERCVRIAESTGSVVLVNDRVDVALAAGAGGVQLGHRSFEVLDARRLLGPDRLIGVSIHDREEASRAVADGADFVVAGTLYPSPSHPSGSARGPNWLEEIAGLGRPIIGIGGITPDRVREVRGAGAYGVAVIRGIWGAAEPVQALRAYLNENRMNEYARDQDPG